MVGRVQSLRILSRIVPHCDADGADTVGANMLEMGALLDATASKLAD
jgi:hypothetical protein